MKLSKANKAGGDDAVRLHEPLSRTQNKKCCSQ